MGELVGPGAVPERVRGFVGGFGAVLEDALLEEVDHLEGVGVGRSVFEVGLEVCDQWLAWRVAAAMFQSLGLRPAALRIWVVWLVVISALLMP